MVFELVIVRLSCCCETVFDLFAEVWGKVLFAGAESVRCRFCFFVYVFIAGYPDMSCCPPKSQLVSVATPTFLNLLS